MKCKHCNNDSGNNVVSIRKEWTCPICIENPFDKFVPLKIELEERYHDSKPGRYVYISDLSNNLSKIQRHFEECVDLNNLLCTVTLVHPEGVNQLQGVYDGVYVDKDINDKDVLIDMIELSSRGYVKLVEPIRQCVE